MNKLRLGDRKMEVNILIEPKQLKPFEVILIQAQQQNTYFNNFGGNLSSGYSSSIMSSYHGNVNMNPNYNRAVQEELKTILDESYTKKVAAPDIIHTPVPIPCCTQEEGNEPVIDELFVRFKEIFQAPAEPQDPMAKDLGVMKRIEETYEMFWSGFITKSIKNHVGVDGYFISGDYQVAQEEIFTLKIHNMNVSHKSNVEELLKRPPLAVVLFIPSNETQKPRFCEYRSYFKEKRIIGIVNHFKNKIVYIFPYYEEIKHLISGIPDGLFMIGFVVEMKRDELEKKDEKPGETNGKPNPDGDSVVLEVTDNSPKKLREEFNLEEEDEGENLQGNAVDNVMIEEGEEHAEANNMVVESSEGDEMEDEINRLLGDQGSGKCSDDTMEIE